MLSMNFWFFAFTVIIMVLVAFVGFFAKQMDDDSDEEFYRNRYDSVREEKTNLEHQIWMLERQNDQLREEISNLKMEK